MQIRYREHYPQIHPSAYVGPQTIISGQVEIGEGASVWPGSTIRGDLAAVIIGKVTNLQEQTVVHVDRPTPEWNGKTTIGEGVTVGHRAVLHSCKIGNNCLIGMGAILLTGVEVGEGSIIAAGAVVREGTKIPPRSLVVGLPAIIKGTVSEDCLEQIKSSARTYMDLTKEYQ